MEQALCIPHSKKTFTGNSLTVQWLELCTFTAEGLGSGEISEQASDVLDSTLWGSCLQRELIRTQCRWFPCQLIPGRETGLWVYFQRQYRDS